METPLLLLHLVFHPSLWSQCLWLSLNSPSPLGQPLAFSIPAAWQPDVELSLSATPSLSLGLKSCISNWHLFGYTFFLNHFTCTHVINWKVFTTTGKRRQSLQLTYGCNRGARTQFLTRNTSRSHWTQESVQEAKLLYTNPKLSVNTQNWSCPTS